MSVFVYGSIAYPILSPAGGDHCHIAGTVPRPFDAIVALSGGFLRLLYEFARKFLALEQRSTVDI